MQMSPLGWLDALVPKDSASRQIATAVRYGPDPRHLLDLYAPTRGRNWPLMVFVYGGGWEGGSRSDYHFAGRALAALGLLTAVVDYRVYPQVHFPAFVDDVGRAAHWLGANAAAEGGDPGRVVLAGHSSGAYNVVMLALQPERFGAPELAGRIAGVVGLAGPYDFYPFDVRQAINAFGRAPEPRLTQPVNLVTPAAPPMLLAHGIADTICGDYHTVRLAQKLREAGVGVVERHYAGLGHEPLVLGLMRPFRRLWPVYGDVAQFLRERAVSPPP
ncbi:MAG TPA: alpha/beta hydrolase [Devosia sp.]|nr:alpha/beta hydrolase [Devosia sp.]